MAIDTYTPSFSEILTKVSKLKTKKDKVYQHIYSSYFGSGRSVYKQTA